MCQDADKISDEQLSLSRALLLTKIPEERKLRYILDIFYYFVIRIVISVLGKIKSIEING